MSAGRVLVWMGVGAPPTALAALARGLGATVAHLQVRDPSLGAELARRADDGDEQVEVLGVGTSPGSSWLRRVAAHWWREHPAPPRLLVAPRLLADPDGPGAGQDAVALLAGARPRAGTEAGLTSAAWEEVPRHRHQVFVCRGPRCTARGADRTAVAIAGALSAAGLDDDDVLVTQTGCQFPCNQAPVVSVQPDDVWYGGVGPEEAADLVAQHLQGGRPPAALRLGRSGPRRP